MARRQDFLNHPDPPAGAGNPGRASYPGGRSPDEIRRDIEQTRAHMDETVDALGDRLRPRQLLDELMGHLTGGDARAVVQDLGQCVRESSASLVRTVRHHPIPTALIGAGVAWMFLGGGARRASSGAERGPTLYQDVEGLEEPRSGMLHLAKRKLAHAGEALGGVAATVGHGVAEAAQAVTHKVAAAAGTVREGATGAAGAAGEYLHSAGDYFHTAGDKAARYSRSAAQHTHRGYDAARAGVGTAIDDYPLASGVAALAVGALAGLLLPATRPERRWVAPYAEQVKERAEQTGRQWYERGKAAVGAASSAAAEALQEHDLKPGTLVEKALHVAEQTLGAAKQSAGKLVEDAREVAADARDAAVESAHREGLHPQELKETAQDVAQRATDAAKEAARGG